MCVWVLFIISRARVQAGIIRGLRDNKSLPKWDRMAGRGAVSGAGDSPIAPVNAGASARAARTSEPAHHHARLRRDFCPYQMEAPPPPPPPAPAPAPLPSQSAAPSVSNDYQWAFGRLGGT